MRRNSVIYSATQCFAHPIFSFFYQMRTEREWEIPRDGPAIILPKHQYWTDIPLVSLCYPFPLYFVAKKELFHFPGIRSFLSLVGGIPLDREQSIRTFSAIKSLLTCFHTSGKIVLFPEGTYVRGAVGPGKNRLIQMILGVQTKLKQPIPFVPMGIHYGPRAGLRRNVEVRIGMPLFASGREDAIPFTERIMEEISRLSRLPRRSTAY